MAAKIGIREEVSALRYQLSAFKYYQK